MPANKLSRRAFLSRAGLVGAGVALAACTPKTPEPSGTAPTTAADPGSTAPTAAPNEVVTLRFTDGFSATVMPAVEKIIREDFEANNPDIKVSLEPRPEAWQEKLLAEMIAGTAVDIFQAWGELFANWAERGLILDLDPLVERDMTAEDIAEYNDFQWTGLVMKGVRVGLPKYINTITISYNKDLFDKYGVAYPPADGEWNREDYRNKLAELSEAIKSAGDKNTWPSWLPAWEYDRLFGPLKGFGGVYVAEKYGKESLLGSDECLEGMQYFWDLLFKDNYHAQSAQIEDKWDDQSIAGGLVVMAESSTQPINREKLWNVEGGINWDMVHVPYGPTGKRAVLGTTDSWAITAQSKHQEESWRLLRYLSGPIYQQAVIVEAAGQIPVLKSMIDGYIDTCRTLYPRMKDVRLETIKELLDAGYAEDAPWHCNQLAANEIITPALQKIFMVGDVGPEYIKEIVPQVNQSQADCTLDF